MKRTVLLTGLALVSAGVQKAAAAPANPTAAGFLNFIGICGTSTSASASQMAFLGIRHLRTDNAPSAALLAAAQFGAKIDVIVPWYLHAINTSTLSGFMAALDPAASVIESIEGPNEVNRDPDTFNGLPGPAGILAEQTALFAAVKADSQFNNSSRNVPVYNFSVLQGTPAGLYTGMSAFSNYGNVHAYGGPGIPPSWILPYELSHNTIAGNNPNVLTETGAHTMAGTGVDQPMQAIFDIDALLDAYQLNVPRAYLYNLQDWATGANVNNFSAHYGLFNTDGTSKLAAVAMHNLTSILSIYTSYPPTAPVAYTVTGLPYYGKAQYLQSAGRAFVILWNETMEWNAGTSTEIPIPTNNVTLHFASSISNISVYDPLRSVFPVLRQTGSSVVVPLNRDPMVIQVSP